MSHFWIAHKVDKEEISNNSFKNIFCIQKSSERASFVLAAKSITLRRQLCSNESEFVRLLLNSRFVCICVCVWGSEKVVSKCVCVFLTNKFINNSSLCRNIILRSQVGFPDPFPFEKKRFSVIRSEPVSFETGYSVCAKKMTF